MTQPVMHMNIPSHPGELVKANLDKLVIDVLNTTNAFRVTRQQLYNVIRARVRSCLKRPLAAVLRCGSECKQPTTGHKHASVE